MTEKSDPLFDIHDHVIVVTGAASGLGEAVARFLAGRGARIALLDRDAEALERTAASLPGSLPLVVDVTDEAGMTTAVDQARAHFGRIDGGLNSAGILVTAPAETLDEQAFRRSLDVNLTGAFLFSRVLSRALPEAGGRIVHIASVSSFVSNTEYAAYSSSKAGLAQLVRVLGREWAPRNILVNAIGPAVTETPMSRDLLTDDTYRNNALSVIPMGRFGNPDDLYGAILLLLAPAGRFMTGQTLYVDGGRTLV